MKKILIANFKGGVGKTSTAVLLSHSLFLLNKKVLLVDADPQGNASIWLEPNAKYEIADLMFNKCNIKDLIVKTQQGFDIICTFPDGNLRQASEITCQKSPYFFDDIFSNLENKYDFIIIDSSPSFSPLERSLALSANEVICPVELEFFAVNGISKFYNKLSELNKNWRKNVKLKNIILTKVNKNFTRHKLLQVSIAKKNSKYSFFTVRQDSALAESIGLNKTIFEKNKNAKSAVDYFYIVKKILKQGN